MAAIDVKIAKQKFGGGMDALSKTFEGQMSTLSDNFNQAKNVVTQPIFDVLKDNIGSLNDMLSSGGFQDALQNVAHLVADGVGNAVRVASGAFDVLRGIFLAFTVDAGAVGLSLDAIRRTFGDTVADAIQPFAQAFMEAIPQIQAFATNAMVFIGQMGDVLNKVFSGDLPGALQTFIGAISATGGDVLAQVSQWGQAFLSWIEPLIPPLLKQLGELGAQAVDWILHVGLPLLVNALGEWAGAFIDWIAPQVDPLLHELGGLLANLVGWLVDTGLPALLENLAQWGGAFVEWVAPRIPPLLAELANLLAELGGWLLSTALPAIIDHLAKWGAEFVAWVGPQIPLLLDALGDLLGQLGNWIIDTGVPALVTALVSWGKAFLGWIGDVVQQMPGELANIGGSISEWVTGDGLQIALSEGAKLGGSVIQGVVNGLADTGGSIWGAMTRLINNAFDAGKKAADSSSPSQRAIRELGLPIVQGAVLGIQAGADAIGDAMTTAVNAGFQSVQKVDVVAQFGSAIRSMGFNEATIESICGPIAATGIANALGKAVSLVDVEKISEQIGAFTPGQGTHGTGAFERILSALGIDSRTASFQEAVNAAMQGIPVAISTPLHYFLAQGFDQATQQFDVGQTGLALKRGAEQMSLDMIQGIAGAATFVIPAVTAAKQAIADMGDATAAAAAKSLSLKDLINAFGGLGAMAAQQAGIVVDSLKSMGSTFSLQDQLMQRAVETFADRTHISWDQAAGYIKQYGITAQQILGHDIPQWARGSADGMDGMRSVLQQDKDDVVSYLQSIGVTAGKALGEDTVSALAKAITGFDLTTTAASSTAQAIKNLSEVDVQNAVNSLTELQTHVLQQQMAIDQATGHAMVPAAPSTAATTPVPSGPSVWGGYGAVLMPGPNTGYGGFGVSYLYDDGGYLPTGVSQVVNLTGQPEPVLTPGQLRTVAGGGNPVITGDIVLQLDGQVLARVTRKELLQLARRNGNAFGSLGIAVA
jgi:hypothetical protein